MHVPDGYLGEATSLTTGVVAAAAVGWAVLTLRREQAGEATPAGMGLVACVVFAAQMLNFPVGNATSGHVLGAALAVALLGLPRGIVCVSSVVFVQSLVFADGGLTALGTNLLLLVVVPALVAHVLVSRVPADRPAARAATAAAAAWLSVVAAAFTFCVLHLVGGVTPVAFDDVAGAMIPVHAVIGLGEAVMTGLALLAVGFKGGTWSGLSRERSWSVLLVAVVAAGALSFYADADPDGLERSAATVGFADSARAHPVDTPFAGYVTAGVAHARVSTAAAGLVGIMVCLVVASSIGRVVGARSDIAHVDH